MKKTVIKLFTVCLLMVMLSACNSSKIICFSCGNTISESNISYCPFCGERVSYSYNDGDDQIEIIESDSKKIIGTWQHIDSRWGLFEYVFYSDGFCKSSYIGEMTSSGYYRTVGGVNPALYPDSFYDGSGDGYWYFTDNMLRIEYIGEEQGTVYHTYYFNEDGTVLTIEGKGKYATSAGTAIWNKVA